MVIPKVASIRISGDYSLLVTFDNHVTKEYNLSSRLNDARFEILKNKAVFKSVKVDEGGYGISWSDVIDLSEYELWVNGKEIKQTGVPV